MTIVNVTQKHIDDAVHYKVQGHRYCSHCPIALAINELLKPEYYCLISGMLNQIMYDGVTMTKFTLPQEAVTFIACFDTLKNKPGPICFNAELDKQYLKETT